MKLEEIIDQPLVSPIADFLAERSSLGIYIPAYQRPFSWGEEQFNRFFEDVAADIKIASASSHCGLFLGFVICYDDCEKAHVIPGEPNEQPLSVYNIVDGQQRISFISILSVLLHRLIETRYQGILKENRWFRHRSDEIKAKLEKVFSVDLPRRPNRPRLIRALKDQWSTSGAKEQFTSPIADFLNQYLNSRKIKKAGEAGEKHSKFLGCVKDLDELLLRFCQQKPRPDQDDGIQYELGGLENLLNNAPLMDAIFASNISADYKKGSFDLNSGNCSEKKELFVALLLGNYLYRCVQAVVVVTRKSYDRTLSIFDELNSTGIPLNAFDTFKPEVIKFDTSSYSGSCREKYIERISKDIENIKGRQRIGKHVSELITSFALACDGEKIGSDLFVQRDYLRRAFSPHLHNEERYLETLSFFSTVNDMKRMFDAEDGSGLDGFLRSCIAEGSCKKFHEDGKMKQDIDEATFCLRFLNKGRFTITIALLSIYLHQVRESGCSKQAINQFCSAVRKTASFFAIWRSSFPTTHGIEGRIRGIMGGNAHNTDGEKMPALAMNKTPKPFDAGLLGSIFIGMLRNKEITTERIWTQKVNDFSKYNVKGLPRFILLVGSNKTKVVESAKGKHGLEIVSSRSAQPLITRDGFDNPLIETIEHIIPTNEEDSGNGKADRDKNQLWNLTLVPSDVNKILSNRSWENKQLIYKCFSAENEEEWERALEEVQKQINEKTFRKLRKTDHGYLPMTEYLAMLQEPIFA